MPLNDLASFDLLRPTTGTSQDTSKLCPRGCDVVPRRTPAPRFTQAAGAKTPLVTAVASSWAEAVSCLWKTPRPRIILAKGGGESFTVVGGEGLRPEGERGWCWLV